MISEIMQWIREWMEKSGAGGEEGYMMCVGKGKRSESSGEREKKINKRFEGRKSYRREVNGRNIDESWEWEKKRGKGGEGRID